jgi:putative transcriptional regulator
MLSTQLLAMAEAHILTQSAKGTGYATIKLRLRELLAQREDRENRRIRLAEIAEATGISVSVLTPMINNQTDRVSLSALAKLCDYLHTRPAELLQYSADDADEDTVDARDIVDRWERKYGADEHPPEDPYA